MDLALLCENLDCAVYKKKNIKSVLTCATKRSVRRRILVAYFTHAWRGYWNYFLTASLCLYIYVNISVHNLNVMIKNLTLLSEKLQK